MTADIATRIVIIGAGQAGATAAMELRRRGFAGSIVLVGDETHAPYERPPLSKDALLHPESARLQLWPQDKYAEQDIELKLGARATRIDADAKTVALSNGETFAFDKLLLATGAQPRRLPELDALGDSVHVLRTIEDASRIRAQLWPGKRALLVGAGVIGLELASSLTELGLQIEVIDPAPRAMLRNSPEILGNFLQRTHEARGVKFHFGTSVRDAKNDDGKILLALENGTHLEGDVLVYGIGVITDGALAESAGLRTLHGAIVIDEHCRTSHADIHAAGDAVLQLRDDGRHHRVETWENANQQAVIAACDMLGLEAPLNPVPWFWTDQCGLNVQFSGDMAAPNWIVRGDVSQAPFLLWGLDDDGHIVAAITVNQGKDMRPAKDLIGKRAKLPAEVLTDPTGNLRNLAKKDAQTA